MLENLDVDVRRGEILAIVGASGTGKSVLVRSILGLVRPQAGTIEAFGETIGPDGPRVEMEKRWGVLFQFGALFSVADGRAERRDPDARVPRPSGRAGALRSRGVKIELVGLQGGGRRRSILPSCRAA